MRVITSNWIRAAFGAQGSAIALVASLFFSVVVAVQAADPAPAAKPVLTVTATRVQKSTLPLTLQANGNVAAWQEASVSAEVGGMRISDFAGQRR